jgi:hypothetical protein
METTNMPTKTPSTTKPTQAELDEQKHCISMEVSMLYKTILVTLSIILSGLLPNTVRADKPVSALQVVDSTGAIVGYPFPFNLPQQFTDELIVTYIITQINGDWVALQVNPDGFGSIPPSILYPTPNCSGQGFLSSNGQPVNTSIAYGFTDESTYTKSSVDVLYPVGQPFNIVPKSANEGFSSSLHCTSITIPVNGVVQSIAFGHLTFIPPFFIQSGKP